MTPCQCDNGTSGGDGNKPGDMTRREMLTNGARLVVAAALAGLAAALGLRRTPETDTTRQVWQIDPARCVQCGRCATACVVGPSAVKCVHAYDICGYCDLCFAYFRPGTMDFDTSAEKQLCPTFAIKREFVEAPYYEYTIDEERCIGCAKCVKGCQTFGNGSLYLQIRQDRCVNCNQCAIASNCPADAVTRLPTKTPYQLKGGDGSARPVASLDMRPSRSQGRCTCCTPTEKWQRSDKGTHAT